MQCALKGSQTSVPPLKQPEISATRTVLWVRNLFQEASVNANILCTTHETFIIGPYC